MVDYAYLLQYVSAFVSVSLTSVGVGLGQGKIALSIVDSMNVAPKAQNDIVRIGFMGMALAETAAVIGVSMAVLIIFTDIEPTIYSSIANLGIAFAIGVCGGVVGYVSYKPAQAAIRSLTRQPFFGPKIMNLMLITMSLLQTPIIFGFIISFFIHSQAANAQSLIEAVKLLSGGICIGIGTIGPSIGLADYAQAACQGIGINRHSYANILSFTFLSEAIIETPIIFALLTALVLVTIPVAKSASILKVIIFLSAAIATGITTIAAGIASGKTAAAACLQIAKTPSEYNNISKASMIAQGLLDTCPIYGLIISLMLLFVT